MPIPRLAPLWFGFQLCLLLLVAVPPSLATTNFDAWLLDFQREAQEAGITERTLRQHLEDLAPIPRVIELDRAQAPKKDEGEKKSRPDLGRYLQQMVPESRIRTAREKFAENRELLQDIGSRFQVEPTVIVALWAIESDFGRRTGNFPVVGALATLAYDGRRGDFFRGELLQLLKLIDQGAIRNADPRGSWAGAMGQVQFMPSSYRRFALDYDGDGHMDLWGSTADALASAASYLSQVGWRAGEGWGQKVSVPKNFQMAGTGLDHVRTLGEWRGRGVRGVHGPDGRKAALIFPEGPGGAAYLVTRNFIVLRKWNRSDFFALAVCRLAEEVEENAMPADRQLAGRSE